MMDHSALHVADPSCTDTRVGGVEGQANAVDGAGRSAGSGVRRSRSSRAVRPVRVLLRTVALLAVATLASVTAATPAQATTTPKRCPTLNVLCLTSTNVGLLPFINLRPGAYAYQDLAGTGIVVRYTSSASGPIDLSVDGKLLPDGQAARANSGDTLIRTVTAGGLSSWLGHRLRVSVGGVVVAEFTINFVIAPRS